MNFTLVTIIPFEQETKGISGSNNSLCASTIVAIYCTGSAQMTIFAFSRHSFKFDVAFIFLFSFVVG